MNEFYTLFVTETVKDALKCPPHDTIQEAIERGKRLGSLTGYVIIDKTGKVLHIGKVT